MARDDGKDQFNPSDSGRTNPLAHDAPIGVTDRIGRYRVERILGTGGFGIVYLAHDEQLSRPVAIKVPHAKLLSRPEDAQLYATEARTVANLDHPTIVPVYDVGTTSDFPFFVVSKYIKGADLATFLKSSQLSHVQAAELVATVAEALHYAHKEGLVHRDIKPGNILIDKQGKPFVVDFGLALRDQDLSKAARYAGTPAYMSPEQARGEGHRVDGRSDIFSLGVMFYEMLVGRRPFWGDSTAELLEHLTSHEPRPPRQADDTLPKELERICLKMLSKKAIDRYTTAKDVVDDLRHFLSRNPIESVSRLPVSVRHDAPTETRAKDETPGAIPATPTPDESPINIVPKGLRSFDEHDADFFLELLPGPRDREGLPDSIRFWKKRIEEADSDKTFLVGLIYGPSGCGKSSLVKAGLVPRLSKNVVPVYIEATAETTETRLLLGLRKHCPAMDENLNLRETLAAIRHGQGIRRGEKVLIVLDQFEQWLHAKKDEKDTELVQALRQCDGEHVQCIVMVRDDFWLAVSRFMSALEVDLLQGKNLALVDLFDIDHARKVLSAFGRAFGRISSNSLDDFKQQKEFVKQAAIGLAEDGKVVCVRLALFAEMLKGKPWNLTTLKEVGGTTGVGVTFLEEAFSSAKANPKHRLHQQAARAVLKALLPEAGTDIKGNTKSYDELLDASGYGARPKEFDDLIRILDSEIRLITPTEPEGVDAGNDFVSSAVGQKYFQLTHDYLVLSLREWLTRKQRETRRGRAELRLAERSALWNAKPENRHLPSLWEYLNIRLLTNRKNWTKSHQKMMDEAGDLHGARSLVVTLVAAVVVGAGFLIARQVEDRQNRNYANVLAQSLTAADTADVENLINELRNYRNYRQWTIPHLENIVRANSNESKVKLHASMALVGDDPSKVAYLADRLLTGKAEEVPVIVRFLYPHKDSLSERLWESVKSGSGEQRIRAAAALAEYDPQNGEWLNVNADVVTALLLVHSLEAKQWIEMLRPVGMKLVEPLEARYRDRSPNRDAERPLTAAALADYYKGHPQKVIDLLLRAETDREFQPLLQSLRPYKNLYSSAFRGLLSQSGPNDKSRFSLVEDLPPKPTTEITTEIRDDFWKRQANATVYMMELGEQEAVWPLLKQKPNPSLRSFIIDRLARLGADFKTLADHLLDVTDPSIHQSLILALGAFDSGKMSTEQRQSMVEQLATVYRTNPDSGIHSGAAWALRRWRAEHIVKRLDADLRNAESKEQPNWFINSQGQTFVVVNGPVDFLMGETPQKKVTLSHRFAMAAHEVTVAQFQQARKDHQHAARYGPQPDCSVNNVSWYDAVAYCNWLNEQEGISQDQWCYEPNDQGKYAEGMKIPADFAQRTGYRLPTETEWEYACRAGSTSAFSFGDSEELLEGYAWFNLNSKNRMWPVGLLKPNVLGMFDMHGNAWEWCHDLYESKSNDAVATMVRNQERRVLRGGAFYDPPEVLRSTDRGDVPPDQRYFNMGFRAARTYP